MSALGRLFSLLRRVPPAAGETSTLPAAGPALAATPADRFVADDGRQAAAAAPATLPDRRSYQKAVRRLHLREPLTPEVAGALARLPPRQRDGLVFWIKELAPAAPRQAELIVALAALPLAERLDGVLVRAGGRLVLREVVAERQVHHPVGRCRARAQAGGVREVAEVHARACGLQSPG